MALQTIPVYPVDSTFPYSEGGFTYTYGRYTEKWVAETQDVLIFFNPITTSNFYRWVVTAPIATRARNQYFYNNGANVGEQIIRNINTAVTRNGVTFYYLVGNLSSGTAEIAGSIMNKAESLEDSLIAASEYYGGLPTGIDINDCGVVLNPTYYEYDGTAKTPQVTVTYIDTSTTPPTIKTLIENTDYTLEYANNVNPGTASVTITGIGEYTNSRTETFTIVDASHNIANCEIGYNRGPYNYTGSAITLNYVGVTRNDGVVLIQNEDYIVQYQNNVNVGTASLIVRGLYYYQGSVSLPFYIVRSTESPFAPGGYSGEGGGEGDEDYSSTSIPAGSVPTLSPANSGLTRIYVPTLSQLTALGQYLWYTDSTWETVWNHVKEMVGSLAEAIIGLNFLPFTVPSGTAEEVRVLLNNTGVYMPPATSQWATVDCGTCNVTTQAGSFLDYAPYTSIQLFLPFIGTVDLDTDEVMGKTLHVVYRFDIVSGACTAVVEVDGNVFYQYSGQAAIACPVTSANFSEYISAAIGVVGTTVGGLIGGAVGAGIGGGVTSALTRTSVSVQTTTGGGSTTTSTSDMASYSRNPSSGRMRVDSKAIGNIKTVTDIADTVSERTIRYLPSKAQEAAFFGLGPGQVANAVGSVIGSKPHVTHSGAFSGNSGFLGERKCFLTIKRPRQALPQNYAQVCGYPCMMWKNLGDLIGFTKMHEIVLWGISATQNELDEILSFLKSGVIL